MGTLMVSVSGIRGIVGDGLDPIVVSRYASAYADFVGKGTVVVGRDSRRTGESVKAALVGALTAKGLDVVDIGVTPTPTVLYAVKTSEARGGVAVSASHNPNEWNALKLLNAEGEFMTPDEHERMKRALDATTERYVAWDKVGTVTRDPDALERHQAAALGMEALDLEAIRARKFKVVLDCVNGAGAWFMPEYLRRLGCDVVEIDCERTGVFPRLPEPLPNNLTKTMAATKEAGADLGVVVDPDVDRLVLIDERGEPFGEEYTVAMAADFVLSKTEGDAVVNLSTTRAVEDVAKRRGVECWRTPVGEANVVKKMKEVGAAIGGEGSGGVIYPGLHYGRDALVGSAFALQRLVEFGGTLSEYKASLPQYRIAKRTFPIGDADPDAALAKIAEKFAGERLRLEDGVRVDFEESWVHFRKSNTEPILRLVAEARTDEEAEREMAKYVEYLETLI